MSVPEQKVEQTTEQVAEPTIGLADLQNAIKIIDYACDQGAFKGWQVIEQVASVRGKLARFVEHASPKEEVQEEKPAAKKTARKTTKK